MPKPILFGMIFTITMHLLMGVQDFVYLDRTFLPDDTYYILSIARNLAFGHGATTDGVVMTSGFQPLFTLMLVPVFWLTSDPITPVLCAIALSATFGVISIVLLGMIVLRATSNSTVAFVAMTVAATSPIVLRNDLNGLETSLVAALSLGLVWLLMMTERPASHRRMVLVGIIAGLAVLARIDAVVLVFFLGIAGLLRLGMRAAVIATATALVVAAPWLLWCIHISGSPIPESGAALYQVMHLEWDPKVSFWYIAGSFFKAFSGHRSEIYPFAALLIALSLAGIGLQLRRPFNIVTALGLTVIAIPLLYGVYTPVFWFLERYLNFVYLATIILVALWISEFAQHKTRPLKLAAACLVASYVVINLLGVPELLSRPNDSLYSGQQAGFRGYADPTREILDLIPDGTVIGALQSGALGYFARPTQRVLNLDGVVSGKAQQAIAERRMAAYTREQGMTHFVDWYTALVLMDKAAGEPNITTRFEEVFSADKHWGYYRLYQIRQN